MLLSRNIFLCACFLFLFEGCGLKPLYEKGNGAEKLKAIKVGLIHDRDGQLLRNRLEQLLTPQGAPIKPLYTLSVDYKFSATDFAYLNDATATRSQVILTSTYQLREIDSNQIILSKSARGLADYNLLTGADYSTIIAEENAKKRAILNVADQIKLQLADYFAIEAEQKMSEI